MRVFGKDLPDYQDYLYRKQRVFCRSYKDYYRTIRTPPIYKPSPITVYEGSYSIHVGCPSKPCYPYGNILYSSCI